MRRIADMGREMMTWKRSMDGLYLRVDKRRQDGREVQVDLPVWEVAPNVCPTGMSAQIL